MSDEESLEERNLVNLVLYNKGKLKRIQKGVSAAKLFSVDERRKLRRYGILTYYSMTWGLSKKAKEIIERGNDDGD